MQQLPVSITLNEITKSFACSTSCSTRFNCNGANGVHIHTRYLLK